MAGRASIVGAAVTDVGKVRSHNEDSHYFDAELGVFVVCDGMGGHAAGEVASALAVQVIREHWTSNEVLDVASRWLVKGTPESRKLLLDQIRRGVVAAHDAIVEEARADESKSGMGTTLVAAMVIGGDCVFAHAGDSRAYLVRDGIAMQLTEDHTLMARLQAAGVEVDTTGEGSRFKSMLTNALGIGQECKVSTFVVPLADGDRFVLCTDGVSEYVAEPEVGEVVTKQPSPARAAQRLIDLALERGGADNATALVVRVLEAGDQPQSAIQRTRDDEAIGKCQLFVRLSPQQRLRALRIALPRDHADRERIPAQTLGDRVAWILVEGDVEQDGERAGPGTLLYPEALAGDRPLPDRDGLAVARGDVRALALRSDDFRELCEDDDELGEALLDGLAAILQARMKRPARSVVVIPSGQAGIDPRANTDPNIRIRMPSERSALEADVADVPVVVTDKPIVDRPVTVVSSVPKRLGKMITPQAFPAVMPDVTPPVAAASVASAARVAAEPVRAPPAVRAKSAPPIPVATVPAAPVLPAVRSPAPPPPLAPLPSLPKPRAPTAPPVAVPEPVEDPPSQSVEVDFQGLDDHDGDEDLVKTQVGPPPLEDDLPPDPDTQVRLPPAEPVTKVRPPVPERETQVGQVPEEPDTQTRPPLTPLPPLGPLGPLELEPEEPIDVRPDDVADLERNRRKKRLTEGWDE